MDKPFMSIQHILDDLWEIFCDKPYELDWVKACNLVNEAHLLWNDPAYEKSQYEFARLANYEEKLVWIEQACMQVDVEESLTTVHVGDWIWAYWNEINFEFSPHYVGVHYEIIEIEDDSDETIRNAILEHLGDSDWSDAEIDDWVYRLFPSKDGHNHNFVAWSPVSDKCYLFLSND